MREILFRGKRVDNKEWVEGCYVRSVVDDSIFAYIISSIAGEAVQVYSNTVGQYTGLRDKNDNKIVEGDIVEFEAHGYIPNVERGMVVFCGGCWMIEYKSDLCREYGWPGYKHQIGKSSKWQDMGASGTITYTYEIIGNIHDNPELMEEKK